MKKIKKLLLTLCLTLIIISLSGCASISYQRLVNTEGQIIDAVSVKLDEDAISSAGFSVNETKTFIKNKMNEYLNNIMLNFRMRNDNLTNLDKISVIHNTSLTVSEKDNYIIASIKFNNYSTFRYFYGLHLMENVDNENSKLVEEFLVTKNINCGKTIFSGEDAQFITNEFMSYFNNNFTQENAELFYIFGTPESKLHSNADIQYTDETGINYHQWIINTPDEEITTYYLYVNAINWYILAIALTAGLLVILSIVALFKHINKKKQFAEPTENVKTEE